LALPTRFDSANRYHATRPPPACFFLFRTITRPPESTPQLKGDNKWNPFADASPSSPEWSSVRVKDGLAPNLSGSSAGKAFARHLDIALNSRACKADLEARTCKARAKRPQSRKRSTAARVFLVRTSESRAAVRFGVDPRPYRVVRSRQVAINRSHVMLDATVKTHRSTKSPSPAPEV